MTEETKKTGSLWIKLWPIYLIGAGIVAAWQFGLFNYLSLETLREQQETLTAFVANNLVLAVAAFIAIYALATLFMLPGALWITIAGGLLFGFVGGSVLTVVGATTGASLLFFAARSSLGGTLRQMAGSYAEKVETEFNSSPLSYMFAMRFVPAMPFPVANVVPALLGAKYRDYLLTTALGIIPGVVAYTSIGSGLGATFARGEDPDLTSVFWNFLPAAILLLTVSTLPIVYKKFFAKKPSQASAT
ncbi:MAG: VTT domain-containing protein [Pseudomonadota bacterium]